MSPTYTLEEAAERYRITRDDVMRRCRRKVNAWPHCRPSERDSKTWFFTEADIEKVDALIRHTGPMVDSWGREIRGAA